MVYKSLRLLQTTEIKENDPLTAVQNQVSKLRNKDPFNVSNVKKVNRVTSDVHKIK